jgi:hypothetical protein
MQKTHQMPTSGATWASCFQRSASFRDQGSNGAFDYARSNLFDKRRALMDDWANYLT